MEVQTMRPPYVVFETEAVEDRGESIKQGHPVFRDVDRAYITQAGSKDTAVKDAAEYVAQLRRRAIETTGDEGVFNRRVADHISAMYDNWKKGQELPELGIPIRTSLMFTPAQIMAILGANVRTVEDLAVANEQTLALIGMGARALKDMAVNALKRADSDKTAYEMEAIKTENENLKVRLATLEKTLATATIPPPPVGAGKQQHARA